MLSLYKAFIGVVYLEDLDIDGFNLQILLSFKRLAKVDSKEYGDLLLPILRKFVSY